MPWRQRGQRPQPAWISTATRSPTANSSTVGPSFTTVPMYSWPGVKPLLNGSPPSIIAGTPCLMTSISVAQTAIASIRTRTSAEPGSGTGFSTSDNCSGSPSTQAFIVSGIGYSLLRAAVTEACSALGRVDRHGAELAGGRDFEDFDIVRGAQLVVD